jgi:hypothetical protein
MPLPAWSAESSLSPEEKAARSRQEMPSFGMGGNPKFWEEQIQAHPDNPNAFGPAVQFRKPAPGETGV